MLDSGALGPVTSARIQGVPHVSTIFVRVTVEGSPDQVFRFDRAEISVGRARENDLVLAHASVSERHLRLVARDDRFIAVDLKSDGGSFVNERRITAPVIVRHGDAIMVGAYALVLVDRLPPEKTERDLLAAIEKNPGDDDTRAVYCDWLEENGRSDEAEFLRAQLALRALTPDSLEFQRLASAMHALAPKMSLSWRRTVARPTLENCGVQQEIACPKRWDALAPTDSPTARFCASCKRNVHYASTIHEARRLAIAGQCLVVDIAERRFPGDLAPPPPNPGYFAPPPAPPPGYVPDE
jgi:uncharacterized protein (TIGR02996 family)